MKLLHTSDWHLGHTLRDRSRAYEHAQFLAWLLDTVEAEEIDAVLVAGDIFETANPSAEAQQAWYDFLGAAHRRFPSLGVVVIGGNHDSGARLDAPRPILSALNLHVVGGLRRVGEKIDLDRVVVPVMGRDGQRMLIAAVPFLRASDFSREARATSTDGVSEIYREVIDHARSLRKEHEPIVAMGHLYMVGTRVSVESERTIIGHQEALPLDIFPSDLAYAALGHLHLAQQVGGTAHVRYAGSPIPLSMSEAEYRHEVCVVELDERVRDLKSLRVPRTVDLRRIPEQGSLPLADILRELATLPDKASLPEERHPFLEISVATTGFEPGLVEQLRVALADKGTFLGKVVTEAAPHAHAADAPVARPSFTPEEIFVDCWKRAHLGEPPPEASLRLFGELVDAAHQETP